MSPHGDLHPSSWSNFTPPKAPAFVHNLIANIAQDFLHKDSKLLLSSLTPTKLLLDNNGNKLSVSHLESDSLFKLLNREDVVSVGAGKLGSPWYNPGASVGGAGVVHGLQTQTIPGSASPLYPIPSSLYSALLVYPSPFHWNVRAVIAAYITISVLADKLEAPVNEIIENIHWKQNLTCENSIELVMKESLTENPGIGGKLITIDVEKGEMVIEIPDQMFELGGKKLEEILRRGKDVLGGATRGLCIGSC
eukprot:GFUD01029920.1.p1 GENE.GFUD01029920.1~~GFUD01029920.1.p1  ORF type:complete len:250 (-),score=70.52 GFUD01029920.1:7-756(-)